MDFHFGSIQERDTVERLIGESDFVVHFAAALGVKLILEKPVESMETNVTGTHVVLEAAARNRTPVLIASTSEVYGKSNKIPFCEDDDVVLGATRKSRWSYAASKMLDEFLALAYWEEKQLPAIVVRFFNTVGPRQNARYGMVLPTFVRQALEDAPITIHGDGKQTRCFCDVRDTVEAVTRLIDAQPFGEVFNIGSTQEISIEELALLVRERHREPFPDFVHALRPCLQQRLRRYAAARAFGREAIRAHRIPAADHAAGNHRPHRRAPADFFSARLTALRRLKRFGQGKSPGPRANLLWPGPLLRPPSEERFGRKASAAK